ncbi:sensor domain-containing diguanylate cyclase [Pseudonocardia sp. HH130630-07]|uniref:sensor domain-containing diguanylate cyclase n=1 Tax=Pseudonocardia sp. HH130630-07 TaxID=1690815 RepID=UPI0018D44935|nr:sensor domain-containing diguanylate cyclase [Pseudonocardia sp. HH130630-07]
MAALAAGAGLVTLVAARRRPEPPACDLDRLIVRYGYQFACTIDPHGVILAVAPSRGAEVVRRGWREFALPAETRRIDRALEVGRTGLRGTTYSGWIATADGSLRWVDVHIWLDRGRSAAGPVVVAAGRDVTEERLRGIERVLRLTRELELAATTDPLTGLLNRRGLAQAQVRTWAATAATGRALSMLVVDIDHFKDFNDALGHASGDRVLVAIAAAIRSGPCREIGVPARYGGEEFVVLLPGIGADDARAVAEQLVRRVRRLDIGHPGRRGGSVTVTVGVATVYPRTGTPDDGQLFCAADSALFVAKRRGRDRVGVHT